MGCTHKVFATEIDVALFEEAERGRGFGTLKLAREPLAQCAFASRRPTSGRAATSSTAATGASPTSPTPRPAPCARSTCATG